MSKKEYETVLMELKSAEEARAFVFFMMNEKNRHIEDIEQIEETVTQVCLAFGVEVPRLDPMKRYWTVVKPPTLQVCASSEKKGGHRPQD